MKPIWMKIKGLNSFLDAQEIDFKELTSQGLFGIFGPTGSGKSSILDGMTMALYGTTSRNSTNYINVNTDRASVEYIFSVKEKKERIYRVSRSFKRSKEGSIRSDGAKFTELTEDGETVLADKVGAVNEKCREIIGLSKEDFFRTVVLPQGKFSEFLKLEGMERNKMLERLFHLEQYGEHLVSLIKAKQISWDGQKKEKEGALSRYADVHKDKIEVLKANEKEAAALLKEKGQEINVARNELEEAKKTLHLQEEKETLLTEIKKQESMRDKIESLKEELKQAETANLLWNYVNEAGQAENFALLCEQKKQELYLKRQEKEAEILGLKEKKEQTERRMQTEKPALELQKARLEDALVFLKEKQKAEVELKTYRGEAAGIIEKLETDTKKMNALLADIERRKKEKLALLQEIKELTVSVDMQQAVSEGFQFTKELLQSEKKISAMQKQRQEWSLKSAQIEHTLTELKEQEDALVLQGKILDTEFQEKQREKKEIEKRCEKFYVQNLAAILAAELKDGEPCPVCGSRHHLLGKEDHVKEAIKQSQQNYQEKLLEKEVVVQKLEQLEEQRNHLREAIHALQMKKTKADAKMDHLSNRAKDSFLEQAEIEAENKVKKEKIAQIVLRYQVENFSDAYEKIQSQNKQMAEKQKLLLEVENAIEIRIKNKEKGEQVIQNEKTKRAQLDSLIQKQQETIENLKKQIVEKAGTEKNPELGKREIEEIIKKLQDEYAQTALLWEKLQTEVNSLQQEYAAQEALSQSAKKDCLRRKQLLNEKMQEYQVEETDWIASSRKDEQELKHFREQIDAFKESLMTLRAELTRVEKQLGDKTVSAEELQELDNKVTALEKMITEQNKALGAAKMEREQLEKALLEKESLEKALKDIYHKLDILSELDGLFKGKRFVEYVSRYYLEYVSREANERLKEMTGNSFGLETDGSGMFIIRDYKNGGASRPASTLSGGETFLASLALALSLSSQIQMKGAAPLELFFLDEGFGTLDAVYLEVVMESLEKIRNKRRSVGVITHVEEIKERIPVRLLVEPAKMGEGGSKIKIEHA